MVLKIGCEYCFKRQELDYGRKFWGRFYTNKRIHIYIHPFFIHMREEVGEIERDEGGREGDNRIYPHDMGAGEEKTTIKSCAGSFGTLSGTILHPFTSPHTLYTHENTVYTGVVSRSRIRGRGRELHLNQIHATHARIGQLLLSV